MNIQMLVNSSPAEQRRVLHFDLLFVNNCIPLLSLLGGLIFMLSLKLIYFGLMYSFFFLYCYTCVTMIEKHNLAPLWFDHSYKCWT